MPHVSSARDREAGVQLIPSGTEQNRWSCSVRPADARRPAVTGAIGDASGSSPMGITPRGGPSPLSRGGNNRAHCAHFFNYSRFRLSARSVFTRSDSHLSFRAIQIGPFLNDPNNCISLATSPVRLQENGHDARGRRRSGRGRRNLDDRTCGRAGVTAEGLRPIGDDPDASPMAPAAAGRRASAGRTEADHRSCSVPLGMSRREGPTSRPVHLGRLGDRTGTVDAGRTTERRRLAGPSRLHGEDPTALPFRDAHTAAPRPRNRHRPEHGRFARAGETDR